MKRLGSMSIGTMAAFLLLPSGMGMAGEIRGKVTALGMRSPEDIVVYIDAIPDRTFPPPPRHALVEQKNMKFVPHLIAVLKGTTVDFLNSDAVGHNVFWPSIGGRKNLAHNLGTWPKGTSKSYTFEILGAAPLLCNVHPEMSGYVVVVPTPYFSVTNKEGHYEISGVPPGAYILKTWSEEGRSGIREVQLTGGPATVDLTIRR